MEALLLRDIFRARYGNDWKEAYQFPDVREHVLEELRIKICQEIREAYLNADMNYTSNHPGSQTRCPCYLHKYFGADEDIRFPNCPREEEPHSKGQN